MSTSTHTHHTKSTGRSNKRSNRTKDEDSDGTCNCGIISIKEAIDRAEEKEARRTGPKPWIERKFTVGLVTALFAWSNYVFWGIILLRSWRRRPDALVSLPGGIVLSIFYGFFTLMFIITYLKIVLTGPGFARDHVARSDPPLASDPNQDQRVEASMSQSQPAATYPPSIKSPASEHHSSFDEDRLTHESYSGDERERERKASGSKMIGIPYEAMHSRSANGHARTASNSAIPPSTPKALRDTTPSTSPRTSPTTPTSPTSASRGRPNILHKDSKRNSSNSLSQPPPSHPKPSFSSSRVSAETGPSAGTGKTPVPLGRIRAGSSSSRMTGGAGSPPTSPGVPTFANSKAPTHSRTRTSSGSGFKYESRSYILDPPQLNSQTRPRSRSQSGAKTPIVPTGPSTPTALNPQDSSRDITPRVSPSRTRPKVDVWSRTASNVNPSPFTESRPRPYLDDLPPIRSKWSRKPSERPVLDPLYRYCSRDEIIKPLRAHHCRTCNTCVLGYDHHCPWIGGCVGARNRKFFVVFLLWCSLYLIYTIAILIASLVKGGNRSTAGGLDGNMLALTVITGLLLFFSLTMLITHVWLLRHNASTVEWHGYQDMKERERALISQILPVCECLGMGAHENGGLLGGGSGGRREGSGFGKDNVREKLGLPSSFKGRVALRKRWDDEWGRIGKEGNLWWLGSPRKNWEAVMGRNPWTWFLPVGDTSKVGLDYPLNPRFDQRGRWMPRRDWPLELR
ncbi:hypothetical protein FRC20_009620 [Serendipita sp. 405]|nr:hypothetical protein FRC16_002314 [Serendipita sp. 398]KAG8865648.1 hypothetical protein FRC20_009620 [Serendipita sp. 405]